MKLNRQIEQMDRDIEVNPQFVKKVGLGRLCLLTRLQEVGPLLLDTWIASGGRSINGYGSWPLTSK
jgi:hypothetical protein